jgi:hypothetical protein
MKLTGILLSAAAAAGLAWLGHTRSQDYYLAAMIAGFVFFRLATGSSCPLVWLMSKLGVKGLACPSDLRRK